MSSEEIIALCKAERPRVDYCSCRLAEQWKGFTRSCFRWYKKARELYNQKQTKCDVFMADGVDACAQYCTTQGQ